MKTLLKTLSAVLAVVLILGAVWYFTQESKECCLCNSFRYHAPCLIDLETGEMIALDLYFPHPTKVAELADPQPEMETFSFVSLGDVKGTRLTDSKTIELDIPTESITDPVLCKSCRKQLSGLIVGRYVLADLYRSEDRRIVAIQADLCLDLRCYRITAQAEEDIVKVTVQGTLE